jgi:DNA-binding NtrC family response regulator
VLSRTSFDFNRQRIVVADDESPAAASIINTLRHDGHCVTHVGGARSAALDLAFRECHLFICGTGIGGLRAIGLTEDLRRRIPGLPILCLVDAMRWTPELEARLPADVTILREPVSAALLRAAVRPLLPLLSTGTTLAWQAKTGRPCAELS